MLCVCVQDIHTNTTKQIQIQTPSECTWAKVLSLDDAELKWASWEGAVGVDPTIYYIRVETVLHIRVQTRLMMDYTSSTARENKVELTLDAKKKAEQSHIDGAIGKVGMYMDSFGSAEISLQDHGAATLGNSSTNPIHAFAGVTQTLPNIKSLLPDGQDAEEDDEDKDEDDENDDDDETGEEGNKNKKKKKEGDDWWAREEFTVKKEEELQKLIKKDTEVLVDNHKLLDTEHKAADTCICLIACLFA